MPKRQIGQKRYRKYRKAYRQKQSAFALAKAAVRSVAYIKDELLNTENKMLTTTLNTTEAECAWDVGGDFTLLNAMGTGTAYNQRVGNQIKNNSISIKGLLSGTLASASQRARVVLFYDKHPNQSAVSVAQLFETGLSNQTVYAHKTIGVGARFFIMYDKVFDMVGNTDNAKWTRVINIYKDLSKVTKFDGSSGADITDMNSNALYLFIISDQTNASNDGPSFQGSARLRYIDN